MDDTKKKHIFVHVQPEKKQKQTAKQETEIRAHASLVGYHNAQRNGAKPVQSTEIQLVQPLASMLSPIAAALDVLRSRRATLRVVVKSKKPLAARQARTGTKNKDKIDSSPRRPIPKPPTPERLISLEVNSPRYLHIWTQQLFPDVSDFNRCFHIYDVQALGAIRPYLDNPVFESSLASLSHALANFRTGVNSLKSNDVLFHRGKAISMLISQVEASQQDATRIEGGTLLAILYMIMLEMVLGNYKAAEMHKNNLRYLIERSGGLQSLEEHVVSGIQQQNEYWIDVGATLIITPPPAPTSLDYPSVETLAHIQDAIAYLPPGFRQLATRGGIATSNLEFLFRITDFHREREREHEKQKHRSSSHSSSPHPSSSPSPHSFARQGQQQRYRSILDACPALRIPDHESILFQKILCLALTIYSTTHLCQPAALMHYMIKARGELTAKLPSISKHLTPFYYQEQCLFWIYHVTVTAWRTRSGELEVGGAELQLAQRNRFGIFYDQHQASAIIQNFSWDKQQMELGMAKWLFSFVLLT